MSRLEQETTIVFNAEEDYALVWSADPAFWRMMARKGLEPYSSNPHSRYYRVPKRGIYVGSPRKGGGRPFQKKIVV